MKITKQDIKEMVMECVSHILNEAHVQYINQLSTAKKIIAKQWQSPDDFWYIKIDQRYKDFRHFNERHHGTGKWWRRVNGPDGTSRENHVGFAVISGNSLEETLASLDNVTVKLNPWAAKDFGMNEVTSNGNMDAIVHVCNYFFARAYMVINKRSMQKTLNRANKDKQVGLFKGREFNHRAGQARSGVDKSGVDWDIERPWTLIDCDIDDAQAQAALEDLLQKKGITPVEKYPSHDGMHYIFDKKDVAGVDFSSIFHYAKHIKPNDPPILAKRDANMMIYSPCGI